MTIETEPEGRGGEGSNDASLVPKVIELFEPDGNSFDEIVIGNTGGGKTFFCLLILMRAELRKQAIIINPDGEVEEVENL